MNNSKTLYNNLCRLNQEVGFTVGPDRLHKTLQDLYDYLQSKKAKNIKQWRGIPIDFAIKYTKPIRI